MREGSYTTQVNGKDVTVLYTDAELVQDMANLFSAVQEEDQGEDHVAAKVLKGAMSNLQSGRPLTDIELQLYRQLKTKYGVQTKRIANDPTTGFLPGEPEGSGRIVESAALLPVAELARIREQYATASTTKKDKDITAPHLHDGVMHDLAHATQHANRLQDKDVLADPGSIKFNVEHVLNHLQSGIDHASRLGEHLAEHPSNPATWSQEKLVLHQLRESAPKPPPGLDMAQHDEAAELANPDRPPHECGTCEMYDPLRQRCWSYEDANGNDIYVSTEWWCRSWTLAPDWQKQHAAIHARMGESDVLTAAIQDRDLVSLAGLPTVRLYRMREDSKPTVTVDFDGVVYDRSTEPGGNNLAGKLMAGAAEGLAELAREFRIVVLTARPNAKTLREWLDHAGVGGYIADVTSFKPSATAYVDNRSLLFKDWPQTVRDLKKGNASSYESNVPGGTT